MLQMQKKRHDSRRATRLRRGQSGQGTSCPVPIPLTKTASARWTSAELKSSSAASEETEDLISLDERSHVPGMTDDILNKAKDGLQVEGVAGAECNC